MSTELESTNCLTGDVAMTRYWGGDVNGTCLQMTFKKPASERGKLDYGYWYVAVTREQAREMGQALIAFADGKEQVR